MSIPSKVITSKCVGHRSENHEVEVTPDKAILYALGIGASRDPMNQQDLTYTYEKHDDFQTMPTLGRNSLPE